MDSELIYVDDLLLKSTIKRLEELLLNFSEDEIVLTRIKANLNLWAAYLEKGSKSEVEKFIEEARHPKYDCFSYEEKQAAISRFEKKTKELISVYNKKIMRKIFSAISKRLLNGDGINNNRQIDLSVKRVLSF